MNRLARSALRKVRSFLKSSPAVRKLMGDAADYADSNADQFTDLFWHEVMLADRVRVDAYAEGIARNVSGTDVVLDLGTGTGLLAMLAARQHPKKVYAIDHSRFIEVAKRIAIHNGCGDIEFVPVSSRDFRPAEPIDVVVHDQLGADIVNENMLANMADLKQRGLLSESCRFLPGRFELFVEPVSLKPDGRIPFIWEQPVHGLDFSLLRDESDQLARYMRFDYRSRYTQGAVEQFLGEPAAALEIDMNRGQFTMGNEVKLVREVVRDGTLDGFCLHFIAYFDDQSWFTTSPLEPLTHWRNRIFRVPRRHCRVGDTIAYRATMPDVLNPDGWSVTEFEASR